MWWKGDCMPRSDTTTTWLLAHDPIAVGLSRRKYAAEIGILSPRSDMDARAGEECYSDNTDGHHCRCCAERGEVRRRTVE